MNLAVSGMLHLDSELILVMMILEAFAANYESGETFVHDREAIKLSSKKPEFRLVAD